MDLSAPTGEPAKGASPKPIPQRSGSSSSLHRHSHRQSFAESLRGLPPSPRNSRQPSLTHAAVQDLVNHPPTPRQHNSLFVGRDWRDVTVGELVSQADVKWVEMETSVEEATKVLMESTRNNVVLIREDSTSNEPVSIFDYRDLNEYLLAVVRRAHPPENLISVYDSIAERAAEQRAERRAKEQNRGRKPISLRDVQPICERHHESLVFLYDYDDLAKAAKEFGSGIHRILVRNKDEEIIGIFSQMKLVEFFWNEGVNFRVIDDLYPQLMHELGVGPKDIDSVKADDSLCWALRLMSEKSFTSVAVVDNHSNVVGNISTGDVRHLTNEGDEKLLDDSCLHFISVILKERGVEKGQDSYPVFYVNPYSTLAYTVAKLVATRSHRMWVVESASPSPSLQPSQPPVVAPHSLSSSQSSMTGHHHPSAPAASLPGSHISGRLIGVVTLTDILNLFAKATGLRPRDPSEQRARRRRSSSSSVRPSIDSSRPSLDLRR